MSSKPTETVARRQFLKLAGIGAASGAAAVTLAKGEAEASEADRDRAGYRETDHVRAYYDAARF